MARAHVPGKALSLSLLSIGLVFCASPSLSAQQPPPSRMVSLEETVNWLKDARRNYTAVRNYTCTLIKQERVKGQLQAENVILFSARSQPFSVYMKWVSPQKLAGQEVCYVEGMHNGKMRVKAKGLGGGLLPWVNVSPNDPRALEHSNHTIKEAGLGNMIEENIRNLDKARVVNRTTVKVEEYKYDNRICLRLEIVNLERRDFYCARSVLYLDKDSKVPIRLENYDWHASGNPALQGELLEVFSYVSLRFNNLDNRDDIFNK